MATDPVCGMYVDERTADLTLFRDNRTYYFCAASCRDEFADPVVRQAKLLRELTVAWPLAVVAAIATYGPGPLASPWVAGVAAAVVQVYIGQGFYRGAWDAIRSRIGNMDLLIAVGTSAAFGYSVAVLAFPGRLPSATYFDASALILALILSGNYLESRTRARSSSALRRLGEMVPSTAFRRDPHGIHEVPVPELKPGDRIVVSPAGRFPADGTIVEGSTSVDESILTGESRPELRGPGSRVLAGSRNGEGRVDVTVQNVAGDTFLAHVGSLVTEAELSRVPLQALADRIASVFAPLVLVLALVAAAAWYTAGGADLTVAILVFVSVAITACPCAFGIATPAAIIAGTGRAAEAGILFKGQDAVEKTARIDLVLFDKTGTLTQGRPSVEGLATEGVSDAELLTMAAGVEAGADHPFGPAIVAEAKLRGYAIPPAQSLRASPGRGVQAVIGGRRVEVGAFVPNPQEPALAVGLVEAAHRFENEGRSWSVVRFDDRPVGLIAFTDRLRPEAASTIRSLRSMGLHIGIVSGDRPEVAQGVARDLGVEEVRAPVTPQEKVELVRAYQRAGRHVAFVGDGVNDAAALAAADVGIAMGTGTDVAKETGKILLVRSDLRQVPGAITIARATVAKVRQNLWWALGYNAVLLPVAAGILVPAFGFRVFEVLPITGAIAMALSSTSVVLNSLSLRSLPIGAGPAIPG